MVDMASKEIIPAVIKYSKSLADSVLAVKEAGADAEVQTGLLKEVSAKLTEMKIALAKLEEVEAKATAMENAKDQAFYYKDVVKAAMDALRKPADELEMIVDKKVWPFPTYADLMFEV